MNIAVDWIALCGTVAILLFHWNILGDMRTISDRVSRLADRMSGVEGQIGMLASLFGQKKETTQ